MKTQEVKETLKTNQELTVRTINYKSSEDIKKYGESFEATTQKEFIYITVNNLTFRVKRIIEEYGLILFIYNFNQIEINPKDIKTISF